MKTKIIVAAILASLSSAFSAAEDYATWGSYKNITVDTRAQAGSGNVATTQANFPLLVRLTAANASDVFSGSKVTGGGDVRFAAGGTHLPYQMERWDAANSLAEFWVLAPTIKGNDTTQIQIYWGKSGASDSSSASSVFTVSNGYKAVWHLGDAASPSLDATANGASAKWQNAVATTAGYIGNAVNLANGSGQGATGTNGKYLTASNATGAFNVDGTNGVTLSLWMKRTATNTSNTTVQLVAGRYNYSNGGSRQYGIETTNATTAPITLFYSTDGNADATLSSTVGSTAGTWFHVTATLTATSQRIYVNGIQRAQATAAMTSLDQVFPEPFTIGKMDSAAPYDQYFNGAVDEVKLANRTRSADWIKLDYVTQRTDSVFVALGTTVLLPPSNLVYAPNPAVYTVGTAIPANTPSVKGTVVKYAVSPALPAGLALDTNTGVLSGTPTAASAAANYTVTGTNSGGSTAAVLNITVNAVLAAPTAVSYSTSPAVYGVGTAIAANNPIVTGTATSFAVNPGLPAGLSFNTSTGVITGTPTAASAAANYTVTATNSAGSVNGGVNITVLAPPSALSYSTPTANYPRNVAIASNTPTVTGSVSAYSVSPDLPTGLSLNTSTGVITGTPTVLSAAKNYTVTANNVAGSTNATVNINVYGPPSAFNYSTSVASYTRGTAITPNAPTGAGTVTKYTIAPALVAGLVMDSITGIITGTPTDTTAGYVSYTVTAANAAGTNTGTLYIIVSKSPSALLPGLKGIAPLRLSGTSRIYFSIPEGAQVSLSVVDIWGRTVWSKEVAPQTAGIREVVWAGNTSSDNPLSAGFYVARMRLNAINQPSRTIEKRINFRP